MSVRVESLLVQMLEEQKRTNLLLSQLIQVQSDLVQALADDGAIDDDRPLGCYMDGTPFT